VRKKGDLPWQLTKERVQDKAEVKAWGVVAVSVKAWEADEAAKEEWAEERWALKANASVPSAAPSHPIREVFPAYSKNARNVEPRW
jgi:hypothetical protein